MQRVNFDRLGRKLCDVATDVDELFKSIAGNSNEAIIAARERIEKSLRTAKQNLENTRLCVVGEGRILARSTDACVRENMWKAIEIANALLAEGYDEGRAIRIAIAQAKRWATRAPDTGSVGAQYYS